MAKIRIRNTNKKLYLVTCSSSSWWKIIHGILNLLRCFYAQYLLFYCHLNHFALKKDFYLMHCSWNQKINKLSTSNLFIQCWCQRTRRILKIQSVWWPFWGDIKMLDTWRHLLKTVYLRARKIYCSSNLRVACSIHFANKMELHA